MPSKHLRPRRCIPTPQRRFSYCLAFATAIISAMLTARGAAFAHPVSYKDAFGIMPNISKERQDLELNYSYSPGAAAGMTGIRIDDEKKKVNLFIPQFNYRAFRENAADSQANIYLSTGLGLKREDGATDGVALIATQVDYETRRIYTLLSTEHLLGFDGKNLNRVRGRAGVAPYLGDFEDLHTWLIAQVEYTPELEYEWTITPIVRLFYQNYLVEFGLSTRGDPSVSGIFHF